MTKAYSTLKVKSVTEDGEKRTITGIASTPRLDRDGDTLNMSGGKYTLPFPFMWQHDHCQPIGEVVDVTVYEDQIEVVMEVPIILEEGKLKERIDEAWHSLKNSLVKGLSIGFGVVDYEWIHDGAGMNIIEWDWYELSAVTVGANPDAVITSVKSIKQAFLDAENPNASRRVKTRASRSKTTVSTAKKTLAKTSKRSISLVNRKKGGISLLSGDKL